MSRRAHKVFIPGKLTTLNAYINAERGNRYAAAALKSENTRMVKVSAIEKNVPPVTGYPVIIDLNWVCGDRRTDPDNVAHAVKYILDGLVNAGVLENDSWKYISGINHSFSVDKKNPGVWVTIVPAHSLLEVTGAEAPESE